MGVKDLFKLVPKEAIKNIKLEQLAGKVYAIDGTLTTYQLYSAGQSAGISYNNLPTNHIMGTFFRTVKMLLSGVTPIYIFDGSVLPQRQATVDKRRASKQSPGYSIGDVKRLLQLMGVPYYDAPNDGEAFASMLAATGQVDGVISEDSDVLAFGSPTLLRGYSGNTLTEVKLQPILDSLDINLDKFRQLCVMLGNDYNPRMYGPKTALKMLKITTVNSSVFNLPPTVKIDIPKIKNIIDSAVSNQIPIEQYLAQFGITARVENAFKKLKNIK